jgi:glycosyltransferase involved in cell wall biosynthesis
MLKIAFLYTELAAYFMNCVERLAADHEAEVLVIRWPVNREAPFVFTSGGRITLLDRHDLDEQAMADRLKAFAPDCIYVSGWADKGYLKVVSRFRNDIPVILGLDNPWDGSLKQRAKAWLGGKFMRRYFSDVWIPGSPQKPFAKALGFHERHIHSGFYTADVDHFLAIHDKYASSKRQSFPRRFIYCARYVPWKGIHEMWTAFLKLKEDPACDWELWCLGTGEEYDKRVEAPGIRHFGFVQPENMERYLAETGVYILPSHFEPWGVSVHEFAAAGFPMLLGSKVGSASMFLEEGSNGYTFDSTDPEAIYQIMLRVTRMSGEELNRMGDQSVRLAGQLTPKTWCNTLAAIAAREKLPLNTTE